MDESTNKKMVNAMALFKSMNQQTKTRCRKGKKTESVLPTWSLGLDRKFPCFSSLKQTIRCLKSKSKFWIACFCTWSNPDASANNMHPWLTSWSYRLQSACRFLHNRGCQSSKCAAVSNLLHHTGLSIWFQAVHFPHPNNEYNIRSPWSSIPAPNCQVKILDKDILLAL